MTIQDKILQINDILDKEIKQVNQSKLLALIIGIFILIGVGGYLFWLNQVSCKYVNEKNFSNILFDTLSKKMPEMLNIFQQSFVASLPQTMKLIKTQTKKEIISLRIEANRFFRHALAQAFVEADKILEQEIRVKASPYRRQIEKELEILSDPDSALKELEGLEKVIEISIFNEVNHILSMSLDKLKKIEDQMKKVINKKEGATEEEKLIRKFIVYWVNFYEHNFDFPKKNKT
ncbi:MAG: hypothetical protein JW774_03485 [Candidatus Aureabacteria bacterium]|nr:hypothetical protein [Candidatus Auribacterota bacterium]